MTGFSEFPGIRSVRVLDDRIKVTADPQQGATVEGLKKVIKDGIDEITIKENGYVSGKRAPLVSYLEGLGWQRWSFDSAIFLAPTHNCFER